MGKLKSAGRKLDPRRVQMAEQAFYAKHELAMKIVHERVKKDAEFAADVLKVARENLRPEILKDAQETVAKAKAETNRLVEKWSKTGLMDGVKDNLTQAVLLESEEKQLLPEDLDRLKANMEHEGGIGNAIGRHVLETGTLPDSLKPVNVSVPVTPEVIPDEKLREGLRKLSQKQDQRLKDAGLI